MKVTWNKSFARKSYYEDIDEADRKNEQLAIVRLYPPGFKYRHLVQILRIEMSSPNHYIDMELCDGTLNNYIDWHNNLKPSNAERPEFKFIQDLPPMTKVGSTGKIMTDIAGGVVCIHHHDVVHRDLKPSNSNTSSWYR
jgi:serine/threonine protein kinase